MSLYAGDFGENSVELSITDIRDGAMEGITGGTVHGTYRLDASGTFNPIDVIVGAEVA